MNARSSAQGDMHGLPCLGTVYRASEGTDTFMSDMLEKILVLEKNASAVVAEAEADATHRITQVRGETQKAVSEALKKAAREGDGAVDAERTRVAAERERLNGEYREKLDRQPLDTAAFSRAVIGFVEKGGA